MGGYADTVSRRVARFSSCESRSIKTGTCLHLSQGLAQRETSIARANKNSIKLFLKSEVDRGKIHAVWPRAPPLSQLENLATLRETVCQYAGMVPAAYTQHLD